MTTGDICGARSFRPIAKGFTLIEVMIVVAIISILAAIAYPSYQKYVQQGARAKARAVLMDVAQKEERYFTTNGSYCSSSTTCTWLVPPSDLRYSISVTVPGATSAYDIKATPLSGYPDSDCGTLTLSALGVKSASGSGPYCW